jgi:hypothetical protein
MKKIFDYFIRFFGAFLAVLLVNAVMIMFGIENDIIRFVISAIVAYYSLSIMNWEIKQKKENKNV